MPNITSNTVKFVSLLHNGHEETIKRHNKDNIRNIRELLEGHEIVQVDEPSNHTESRLNVFNFNKICPMPNNVDDWYDWRCENWGTKWNSIEAKVTRLYDDSITYEFDTAWDCPRGIAYVIQNHIALEVRVDWRCHHEDDYHNVEDIVLNMNSPLDIVQREKLEKLRIEQLNAVRNQTSMRKLK